MTSIFDSEQRDLFGKVKGYVHGIGDRILRTPERSLDEAYRAALAIASIESEHFNGGKIPNEAASCNGYVNAVFRVDFERNLAIAKIRLTEFKASTFVLGSLSPHHLTKLKFADEVLAKYSTSTPQNSSSALVPISKTAKEPLGSTNRDFEESATVKNGLLPRSLGRTFHKIKDDLNPNSEQELIGKFRRSRNQTIIAVRFISLLIIIPLLTQHISKSFIVSPIVERMVGQNQAQIFLNPEMKEEAFKELKSFEESLKFESLTTSSPALSEEVRENLVKRKAAELAEAYRQKSKDAISNVFADLIAVGAFSLTLLMSQKEIAVLKSFMDSLVYGLSDSAKAFIIILISDIFVGFHSPHGWEVLLEGLSSHLGIAANHSMISVFIATVPVVLDTMFKYWIFRSLSRMSPSTVATLKEMNE